MTALPPHLTPYPSALPMSDHCADLWDGDDFGLCTLRRVIQTIIPSAAAGLSLLLLSIHLVHYVLVGKSTRNGYSKLKQRSSHNGNLNGHVTLGGNASDGDVSSDGSSTNAEEVGDGDELDRNELLALQSMMKPDDDSTLELDRPRAQRFIVLSEEIAVLAQMAAQVAGLHFAIWGPPPGHLAAYTGIAVWAYILILTTLRLYASHRTLRLIPNLWDHTACLYGVQWVISTIALRSQLIDPYSNEAVALASTQFGLATLLLLIALNSRRGNKHVELEYDGDIKPSPQPLASVLSLASFSWVDPLVWTGWKKDLELPDLWNLVPRDQAAHIIYTYRQVKKANSLAWHLVKFFRRQFFLQALWSLLTGALTFVPTLLLKLILEYVEDPESTTSNVAWLAVIMLLFSGVIQALAQGQALWIGRKICIALRAIVVGEVYAKALRRRVGASSDKVLGANKNDKKDSHEEGKRSFVDKLLGRKKKPKTPEVPDNQPSKDPTEDDSQVSSGAIINLMAVDSFKVAEVSAYIHFLWAETPVQFALAIFLLYRFLGWSSIVGLIMMALLLPINMVVAKKFTQVQTKILAATDARIHTTNEVLTNIRIIKYFAWEQRFLAIVDEKRKNELKYLRNRYILWAIAATVWCGAPVLITLLSFLFYTKVEKKPLIPSIAFTALSLFSLLRVPLDQLADMVAHVQESKVSIDRVEEYLNEPETDKYKQLKGNKLSEDGQPIIGFDNATFTWGSSEGDDFKMIDLDLRFKTGQLNVVIGPTGSGKTSMLMALLGEMTLLDGQVYLPGAQSREGLKPDRDTGLVESVAYCSQQAWLVNGSIKENIVFASPWNAKRYKQTIIACSLQRDLEILDSGDETLVGEKGVTLSGGQKQRISLARALYCNAKHVLLDDVLSAVDAHTAKWIFDKALMGPLMYHRTCILVTHNAVLCLPHAEFAVVVDNGRVVSQGSAAEVISSGKLAEDFSKHTLAPRSRVGSALPSRVPSGIGGDAGLPTKEETEPNVLSAPQREGDALVGSHIPPTTDALARVISKDIPGLNKPLVDNGQLDESKATGAVSLSIIAGYFRYMGGPVYWTVSVCFFTMQQLSQVATNVWIRQWANAYTSNIESASPGSYNTTMITGLQVPLGGSFERPHSGSYMWNFALNGQRSVFRASDSYANVDSTYYLIIYGLLGVLYIFVTFFRDGILFAGSLWASKRIHRKLMESVARAKFRFFDSTPLGQIMNRFSKDVEAIDQEVAPVAVGVVHCLSAIISIVVLISVIVPKFLIAAVFISILYFLIGAFFIRCSRDLKRLESVQRSPLYQQFGETLSGMTTIRAYGDERRFIRDNLRQVNTHARPFLYLWAVNRWLAFRVDVVGALVAFSTGVFVLLSADRVDAGAAGLAMTYAVTFTENVLWFVRLYAMNEQNMNAVERVKEYLDVDQEAPAIIEENRPAANWPSKGAVEFIGYSTKYRSEFDYVLKGITFNILSGEKVGVVGRTGAGKSSLALALFRALEAYEGKIIVDDVDIGRIGLQDLRENIVMVPQDPTLFTGTLRSNLDPFGLFTDEEIFTSLRSVQLIGAATATTTPSRPATPASQTGSSQAAKPSYAEVAAAATTTTPAQPSTPTVSSSSDTLANPIIENKNIFRNLSSPVAESGSNLSQGQRQLLCLARAMLKNPKVLLMDEATASIDYATDAKIQDTIRGIKNTTLTIAHRLQTIVDYDKVLVLDRGEVVEFGDPFDLISKVGGSFRGMCETSGDFDVLLAEARKAHEGRKLVDDS